MEKQGMSPEINAEQAEPTENYSFWLKQAGKLEEQFARLGDGAQKLIAAIETVKTHLEQATEADVLETDSGQGTKAALKAIVQDRNFLLWFERAQRATEAAETDLATRIRELYELDHEFEQNMAPVLQQARRRPGNIH